MKKEWIIVAGITVLAVVGGLTYVIINKDSYKSKSSSYKTSSSKVATNADACSYLTQTIADKLLGAGAKKGANPAGNVVGNDVTVSTCSYTSASDGSLDSVHNLRSATMLVRAPKTATGETSNKTVFDSPKAGSVDVSGYGKKAFWDPALGQLNVLDSNNVWFILSIGKLKPADRTQAENVTFAGDIGLSSNGY